MKQIDEQQLETDLAYRYEYLAEFIGFEAKDIEAIHAFSSKLVPKITEIVDLTYEKLLSYDATARHFMPRQHGYEGALPRSMESLGPSTEQIQFRKEHLRRYLMSIVGNDYDSKMVKYLDVVGKIHTPKAGNKQINVPLVQMNALMGFLADVLTSAIFQMNLDREAEKATLAAFHKLLWIQNDLINRHYAADSASEKKIAPQPAAPASGWR